MICLGLNRPQFSRSRASDKVDSRIRSPPIRPIFPQPNLVELTSIPRSVFQEPPAQSLEVATKRCSLGIAANLRFDELESAFMQTRFGCGVRGHTWDHGSKDVAMQLLSTSSRSSRLTDFKTSKSVWSGDQATDSADQLRLSAVDRIIVGVTIQPDSTSRCHFPRRWCRYRPALRSRCFSRDWPADDLVLRRQSV